MQIEKPTPDAVEERGLRSAHAKTFRLPSGEMRCEIRPHAVHYVSDENELRSIDTTVRESDGKVFCEWAPYKFELHQSGVGFDFESREGGKVSLRLTAIGGLAFDEKTVYLPTITENAVFFYDISPGVDIEFRLLVDRVKSFRIIKNSEAARTFEWDCSHDLGSFENVETLLTGRDADYRPLDLSTRVEIINEQNFKTYESWSGMIKVRKDPKTRIKSLSNEVSWPVWIDPTVNVSVSVTGDDGAQYGATWRDNMFTFYTAYSPAVRFRSVAVPQGATISSATLTLNVTAVFGGGGGGGGTFWGVAHDNPAAFTSSNLPNSQTKTTASVTVPPPSTTGIKNYTVTTIIQEIVNRAGFAGDAVSFVGTTTSANQRQTYFEDKGVAGANPGALSITYSGGGGGSTSDSPRQMTIPAALFAM